MKDDFTTRVDPVGTGELPYCRLCDREHHPDLGCVGMRTFLLYLAEKFDWPECREEEE